MLPGKHIVKPTQNSIILIRGLRDLGEVSHRVAPEELNFRVEFLQVQIETQDKIVVLFGSMDSTKEDQISVALESTQFHQRELQFLSLLIVDPFAQLSRHVQVFLKTDYVHYNTFLRFINDLGLFFLSCKTRSDSWSPWHGSTKCHPGLFWSPTV